MKPFHTYAIDPKCTENRGSVKTIGQWYSRHRLTGDVNYCNWYSLKFQSIFFPQIKGPVPISCLGIVMTSN